MAMKNNWSPQTVSVTNGIGEDQAFGAVTPPLYLSSSYTFAGFEKARTHEYSRTRNPTRDQLADTITKLEQGADTVITSSGMAAVDLVLSLLQPDDLLIAPHDCYGGSYRLITMRAAKGQFRVLFIDQNNNQAMEAAFAQHPKLVLIETPSNPLMRIADIRSIAAQAAAVGAKTVVDNTFLSPALQQPIALGADFVIHSTTKYLNGHSDVVGGAVVIKDEGETEYFHQWANITGVTASPFDCYLTLRGIRTLYPRIEQQQKNAEAIAQFLSQHSNIDVVHYPGLSTHPGHDIARTQQNGFGAMLSFEIKGGRDAIQHFVENVRVFTLAESLGGIESLVAHPASMTHLGMGEEARKAAGISDSLLRLSVGLESEKDLLDDLAQALAT